MDMLTRDDLFEIMDYSGSFCVSIYMPTERTAPNEDQNAIRFKSMLSEAEKLLKSAGVTDDDVRGILDPAEKLMNDYPFWRHQSDGLAVFLADGFMRYYRLPIRFTQQVSVAETFQIKNLWPVIQNNGKYYVIALSKNNARFFHGTHYSIQEMTVRDLPKNLAEALKYDDPERQVQFHTHTGGSGKRSAMFHGQGVGIDDEKEAYVRYFRKIDQALHPVLNNEKAPLIVAGVKFLHALYRKANTYPHLADRGVVGNPDDMAPDKLHEKTWDIVGEQVRSRSGAAVEHYEEMKGADRTSGDLEAILCAADDGRVAELFVDEATNVWGLFDSTNREIELHDTQEGADTDLLDTAMRLTLKNGGNVYALRRDRLPESTPVAAVYRY